MKDWPKEILLALGTTLVGTIAMIMYEEGKEKVKTMLSFKVPEQTKSQFERIGLLLRTLQHNDEASNTADADVQEDVVRVLETAASLVNDRGETDGSLAVAKLEGVLAASIDRLSSKDTDGMRSYTGDNIFKQMRKRKRWNEDAIDQMAEILGIDKKYKVEDKADVERLHKDVTDEDIAPVLEETLPVMPSFGQLPQTTRFLMVSGSHDEEHDKWVTGVTWTTGPPGLALKHRVLVVSDSASVWMVLRHKGEDNAWVDGITGGEPACHLPAAEPKQHKEGWWVHEWDVPTKAYHKTSEKAFVGGAACLGGADLKKSQWPAIVTLTSNATFNLATQMLYVDIRVLNVTQ